jgi:glycosyltransferase involved in cell wall biosynthesis
MLRACPELAKGWQTRRVYASEVVQLTKRLKRMASKPGEGRVARRNGGEKKRPTIITTTFDGRLHWLRDLIESILTFTPPPFDLIVVDNGTTDGTKQFLSSLEWAKTICNATNLDDTLGMNQALQFVQTDYVVKIDTDALIGDYGWWEAIYCLMEAHPKIGIAGDVWNPGFLLPSRLYREGWPVPEVNWTIPDHVQGGFMILRKRMLDQIGFFNEEYPHIGMDVEMSHRALSYGWELGHIPFVITRMLHEMKNLADYKVYHPVTNPLMRGQIMSRVRQARSQGASCALSQI